MIDLKNLIRTMARRLAAAGLVAAATLGCSKGSDGAPGAAGPAGRDGRDGLPGPAGSTGPEGQRGLAGPAGALEGGAAAPVGECEAQTLSGVDVFLNVQGIPGESVDATHPNEIMVRGIGWDFLSSPAIGGDGGSAPSHASVGPICFIKLLDVASPKLMQVAASGQTIETATFSFARPAVGLTVDYMSWTLDKVIISSFQTGVGTDLLAEKISFVFGHVRVEYRMQKPDGTLDTPIVFEVDNSSR